MHTRTHARTHAPHITHRPRGGATAGRRASPILSCGALTDSHGTKKTRALWVESSCFTFCCPGLDRGGCSAAGASEARHDRERRPPSRAAKVVCVVNQLRDGIARATFVITFIFFALSVAAPCLPNPALPHAPRRTHTRATTLLPPPLPCPAHAPSRQKQQVCPAGRQGDPLLRAAEFA